jgi:hypothetical protein
LKTRETILAFLFICLFQSCVYVKYHNYASTLQPEAELIINRLKNDSLIVIVPTYQDKERILKSSQRIARGRTEKKKSKQRLLNLYAERQVEMEAIINAFNEFYTFSSVLYMPDSLISDFEYGINRTYFIDDQFRLNPNISHHNRSPIKLLKQFDQEWQIKIRTQIVPNPFPNYYLYRNGLYGFLGTEKIDQMYERVATVFQRRLEAFFANPNSRISL